MFDGSPLSRISALAAPVLLLVVLAVGTFVGVVRYTTVLDPRSGATPTDELHHDPKPCLRYPSAPAGHSVRDAAGALVDAGMTSQTISDLVGDLYARATAREASLHTLSPVDEQLQVFASGGLKDRLVVALKRDLLREQLAKILTLSVPTRATIASLPPEQRAVIDAQWARDPSVFVLPGLLELVNQLKWMVTEQRLDAIVTELDAQIAAGKAPDLEPLKLEYTGDELRDEWGSDFTLDRTGDDEFTLASRGADRYAGGSGLDADLVRKLRVKPGAAPSEPTAEPEAVARCLGETEVTLKRSEVDEALRDLSEVSKEARVIPAVTNGVVSGFSLKNLRPGFFSRVGLCEGDVVSTLNGVPLTSPDKALEAYATLRNASRVEVALLRGGKPLTLIVLLR